jgi:hypothetical protein
MFIGHFAPALVAATHKEAPALPVLFVAAQLVDWVFFGFVLTGVEAMRIVPGFSQVSSLDLYHMPYTHSLAGTLIFATIFGMALTFWIKEGKGALIAAMVVLSHWFLDLLVHMPDLTLAGTPPKFGFGLWDHAAIEMPLEIGLTMGALWLYARATGGWRTRITILALVLLALQAVDWFGAKPAQAGPQMVLLAWFGYAVATGLAWWVGKSRKLADPDTNR